MFGFTAHELDQLFIDDLDDHLGRTQGFQHIRTDTAFRDGFGEVLDNLIAYIRLQKRHANLTHCLFHVGFLQATLAPKLFESRRNLFGKSFKCHCLLP